MTRLFDAAHRLKAWVRDFGRGSQPAFIEDVTAVSEAAIEMVLSQEAGDLSLPRLWCVEEAKQCQNANAAALILVVANIAAKRSTLAEQVDGASSLHEWADSLFGPNQERDEPNQ